MEFSEQYLTFDEFNELNGANVTLDLMPFNLLEFKARKKVDSKTFGRLKKLETQIQEVKLCMNDLINEIIKYNESDNNISSESVGSYSVSYAKPETLKQERKYSSIIESYLSDCKLEDGTPYLYRG